MNRLKDRIIEMYVTSCGLGYAPVASGTFGTLGGVAIAALVGWTWPEQYLILLIALTVIMSYLGALCGGWAESRRRAPPYGAGWRGSSVARGAAQRAGARGRGVVFAFNCVFVIPVCFF